jgi:hypothetical protein
MLKLCFGLLILFLLLNDTKAQIIEKEKALGTAKKLADLRLLSDSGRIELENIINDTPYNFILDTLGIKANYFHYQNILLRDYPINSKLGLLEFLKIAFEEDFKKRCNEHYSYNIDPKTEKISKNEIVKLIDLNRNIDIERIAGYHLERKIDVYKNPFFIHSSRSVFGRSLQQTLKDVQSVNLIDSKTYADAEIFLKKKRDLIEANLLEFLLEKEKYYSYFDVNKAKQIQTITELKNLNIISESNYQKLINSYTKFEIKSSLEILSYCNQAFQLDIREMPTKPEKYFQVIFDNFRKLMPEFDYQELKINVQKNEGSEQLISISFKINQEAYQIDEFTIVKTKRGLEFRDDFLHLFNKFLSLKNDNLSCYFVYDDKNRNYPFPKFGIILLSEQQKEVMENIFYLDY